MDFVGGSSTSCGDVYGASPLIYSEEDILIDILPGFAMANYDIFGFYNPDV